MRATKTLFYTALLLLLMTDFACSNKSSARYGDGNGAILSVEKAGGKTMTLRKHEQDVSFGNSAPDVYADHSAETLIGTLRANGAVHISQICRIDFEDGGDTELWYQVTNDRISGWIFLGGADPYSDDAWSIVETVSSGGKTWTARKLEDALSVWGNTDVRNKPGMDGTEVAFEIEPPPDRPPQTSVEILAITEETDSIDGEEDHWLKIRYGGKTGWLWGASASAERGGPKYLTPENSIAFDFTTYRNSIDTLLDRLEREIDSVESLFETQGRSYEELVLGIAEIGEGMESVMTELSENYDENDLSVSQAARMLALYERLEDLDSQYGAFF